MGRIYKDFFSEKDTVTVVGESVERGSGNISQSEAKMITEGITEGVATAFFDESGNSPLTMREKVDRLVDSFARSHDPADRKDSLYRLSFMLHVFRSNDYIRRLEKGESAVGLYTEYRHNEFIRCEPSEEELRERIKSSLMHFHVSPYFEKRLTEDLSEGDVLKASLLTKENAERFIGIIAARVFEAACKELSALYRASYEEEKLENIRISFPVSTTLVKNNRVSREVSEYVKYFKMFFVVAMAAVADVAFLNACPTFSFEKEINPAIRLVLAEGIEDFVFIYTTARTIVEVIDRTMSIIVIPVGNDED